MPIYEYQCKNCHHQFELIQKFSDKPETKCPKCLQETAEKMVSASGFQLKGTGWYVTDFKNKPKAASPDAASSSAPATKTEGKKD